MENVENAGKEILIQEKEQVIIADRKYYIGELSLKQFLIIGKLLARTIISSQKKLKELKERSAGNETNTADIITMLELLDDKDLYRFIGCILNEDDFDFLEKNCGIIQTTNIIALLCEHNDIDILKKNISRIMGAINPAVKKS